MSNGATRQHPFRVGEQYRNEDGVYTVTQLTESDMELKYEDGRTISSPIRLQRRIWERIQDERAYAREQAAPKRAKRRGTSARSRKNYGSKFERLQETDFSLDLTGTSWRRREELGGLLAITTSEKTGETFESSPVARRPQVHIVYPDHYSGETKLQVAKFLFDLSEEGAFYGFYIEKSDGPMDDTWDWPRFLRTFAADTALQAKTLVAMENLNLYWMIVTEQGDEVLTRTISVDKGKLHLQTAANESESLDWSGFVGLLNDVPETVWCNLYLGARLNPSAAMELGVEIATEAARVYNALLPLYEASVGNSN